MKIKDKLKYINNFPIIIMVIIAVLGIVLFNVYLKFNPYTVVNTSGYMAASNNMTYNLINNGSVTSDMNIEAIPIHPGDYVYKQYDSFYVGEESKQEVEYGYPLYSADGLTVYNSNRDTVLIDENFDKASGYDGLSLSDGVLYNDGDLEPADELSYYFLSLNNSIFINTQVINIKTLHHEYTIPMNSPCYFGLSYVNYYVLDGKEFKYNRIMDIYYDSIVTIGDKSISYEQFLLKMSLVEEKKETIPEIIEEIEEELDIIKDEIVEPDVIVPEVSVSNFIPSVYGATATLSMVDKDAVMNQYPTFEFYDSHDNLVLRKRVRNVGELSVSGLSANTTYKIKASFKYKNRKDRVFTVDFYEGTITTLPMDALKPVAISTELGTISSNDFNLKNAYIYSDNAESINGIRRIILNAVDDRGISYDTELEYSQIKKLIKGEKITFKSLDNLKSDTNYTISFLAYDKDDNKIQINNVGAQTVKTYKQKPSVKITGEVSSKNVLDFNIKVINPDNVYINNFMYKLIDSYSSKTVLSDSLNYQGDTVIDGSQLLSENTNYNVETTGTYDLEDGNGLQNVYSSQLFSTNDFSTVKVGFLPAKDRYKINGKWVSETVTTDQITFVFKIEDFEKIEHYEPLVSVEYYNPNNSGSRNTLFQNPKSLEELKNDIDSCFKQNTSLICYATIENLGTDADYSVDIKLLNKDDSEITIKDKFDTRRFRTKKAGATILTNYANMVANTVNVKMTINDADGIIGAYKYTGSDDNLNDKARRLVYVKICESSQTTAYCPYKKYVSLPEKTNENGKYSTTSIEINSGDFSEIDTPNLGQNEYVDKNYSYNLNEYVIVVTSENYNEDAAVETRIKFEVGEEDGKPKLEDSLTLQKEDNPRLSLIKNEGDSINFMLELSDEFRNSFSEWNLIFKDCPTDGDGDCRLWQPGSIGTITSNSYEREKFYINDEYTKHRLSAYLSIGEVQILLSYVEYSTDKSIVLVDQDKWNELFRGGSFDSNSVYIVKQDINMDWCPDKSLELDTSLDFRGHSLNLVRSSNCQYLFERITENGSIKNLVMNYYWNVNGYVNTVNGLTETNSGVINNVIVHLNQQITDSKGDRYREYGFSNLNLLASTNKGEISQFIVYLDTDVYFFGSSSLLVHLNQDYGVIKNGYITSNPIDQSRHAIYISDGGYYGNFAYSNNGNAVIERVYNLADIRQSNFNTVDFTGLGAIVYKNESKVHNTLVSAVLDYPKENKNNKKNGPSIYTITVNSNEEHEKNYYINQASNTVYSYTDDYSFNLKSVTNIYTVSLLKTIMGEGSQQEVFWYRKSHYPYLNMSDVMEGKQEWIKFQIAESADQVIPVAGTISKGSRCSDPPTITMTFYMAKDYPITDLTFDDFKITGITAAEQEYDEHTGQKTVTIKRDVEWNQFSDKDRKEKEKHREYTLKQITYNYGFSSGEYFSKTIDVDKKITGSLYKKVETYGEFVQMIDLSRDVCVIDDLVYDGTIPKQDYYYYADIDGDENYIDFNGKKLTTNFINNAIINFKNIGIRNLIIEPDDSNKQSIGFFGYLERSNVENVDFKNVKIIKDFSKPDTIRPSSSYYIGVLAAKIQYSNINKLSINNDLDIIEIKTRNPGDDDVDKPEEVAASEYNTLTVGAIVGYSNGSSIANSYVYTINDGTINKKDNSNRNPITRGEDECNTLGTYCNIIKADKYLKGNKNYLGGLVGDQWGTSSLSAKTFDIAESDSTGSVGVIDSYIIGNVDMQFEVNNNVNVGGIVGYSNGSVVTKNYVDSNFYTGRGQHIGGIIGYGDPASTISSAKNNMFIGDIFSLSPENTVAAIGSRISQNSNNNNYTWRIYSYPENEIKNQRSVYGININENIVDLRDSWRTDLPYSANGSGENAKHPYLNKCSFATQRSENLKLLTSKLIILQKELSYVEYNPKTNNSEPRPQEAANAAKVTLKIKQLQLSNIEVRDPNTKKVAEFAVGTSSIDDENAVDGLGTTVDIYIHNAKRYNGAYKIVLSGDAEGQHIETMVYLNAINIYRQIDNSTNDINKWKSIEVNDNIYLRGEIEIDLSNNENLSKRIHYFTSSSDEPGIIKLKNIPDEGKSLIEEVYNLENVNFIGIDQETKTPIIKGNYGDISNCSFENLKIEGSTSVGIISENYSGSDTIDVKMSNITVKGEAYLGGLIGRDRSGANIDVEVAGPIKVEMSRCKVVNPTVSSPTTYAYTEVGGLIGYKYVGSNTTNEHTLSVNMSENGKSKIEVIANDNCKVTDTNKNVDIDVGIGAVGGILGYGGNDVVVVSGQNGIKHVTVKVTGTQSRARYLGGIVGIGTIGTGTVRTNYDPDVCNKNNNCVRISDVKIEFDGNDGTLNDGSCIGGLLGEGRVKGRIDFYPIENPYEDDNEDDTTDLNYIVQTNAATVGGLVGQLTPWINDNSRLYINSAKNIEVQGSKQVGGVIGSVNISDGKKPDITIETNIAGVKVSGNDKDIGGIIGVGYIRTMTLNFNNILECNGSSDADSNGKSSICVIGKNNTGGLIGRVSGVSNGEQLSNININVDNNINSDYYIRVYGRSYIGGIVGRYEYSTTGGNTLKKFEKLFVKATDADSAYAGGFTGAINYQINNVSIVDSYIEGKSDVGGLAGNVAYNTSISNNVVKKSTIKGNNNVGCLIGSGQLEPSYNSKSLINNQVFDNKCEKIGTSEGFLGGLVGNWNNKTNSQKSAPIVDNIVSNNEFVSDYKIGYLIGNAASIPSAQSSEVKEKVQDPDDPDKYQYLLLGTTVDRIYITGNKVVKADTDTDTRNAFISNYILSDYAKNHYDDIYRYPYEYKYLLKLNIENGLYSECKIGYDDNGDKITTLEYCNSVVDEGGQPEATTPAPLSNKTHDYVVYASGVDKINVEFKGAGSGYFQYKIGDYESDMIAIENRTYTINYDYTNDIEIVLSDGDYDDVKTYYAKDLSKKISSSGSDIYYISDGEFHKNNEVIGNNFVNLYGTKVLSDDGTIYDIGTMGSVDSDHINYSLVVTTPLYKFEYDNHIIETYYNYSLVDGVTKEYQLLVKNGTLNVIDNGISNKKDSYIIDNYNKKEYQIVLMDGEMQSLKDNIKHPETLKNEGIKDLYSDIYDSSAIAVLLYDDGVYAFNYLTGKEVYSSIEKESETLAGFISRKLGFSSSNNNTIDRVAGSNVYNETLDLKEKIEETSVAEASGIIEHNNVAVEGNKEYVTSYNADTKKYDIYDVEELLNDKQEIESENEKIDKNYELVKFYSKKSNGEKDSSLSGVIIFTLTIVAIIWSLFMLVRKRKAREVA